MMKEKIETAAARKMIAEDRAELRRLNALLRASERGRWRTCAKRRCRRRGMCLGLELACAPKPPRPRRPISRAEQKRRTSENVVRAAARIARSIAASL